MAKIVSSGKALHSSEFHEQKKKAKRLKRTLMAFAVLILIIAPFILLRLERFKVKEIRVLGTVVLAEKEILETAREIINENYLWIVPKSNILLLPRNRIAEVLEEKFPRIKFLDQNLVEGRIIEITVGEREPFALYCAEAGHFFEASDCYFLDDEGFIFARAPSFSGEVYFIYSGMGLEEPLGKKFLEVEQFVSLFSFITRLSRFGILPVAFGASLETVEQTGRYTLYLPNSGTIFWNAEENLEIIESNLNSFFASDIVQKESRFLEKISYMDLTVSNKVFYKFK